MVFIEHNITISFIFDVWDNIINKSYLEKHRKELKSKFLYKKYYFDLKTPRYFYKDTKQFIIYRQKIKISSIYDARSK
jgi:hypothetical protein